MLSILVLGVALALPPTDKVAHVMTSAVLITTGLNLTYKLKPGPSRLFWSGAVLGLGFAKECYDSSVNGANGALDAGDLKADLVGVVLGNAINFRIGWSF